MVKSSLPIGHGGCVIHVAIVFALRVSPVINAPNVPGAISKGNHYSILHSLRMTYLNQFHKEAVERKLWKIAESMKSPMNSIDAANYMRRNLEKAMQMESMKQ